MTRDALIALLQEQHGLDIVDDGGCEGEYLSRYLCDCGEEFDVRPEWATHVADLLLLGFAT